MSERKKQPYDEKAKNRIVKCLQNRYEQVRMTVPKGTLAKYKAFAETKGVSMTALITTLMEREMTESNFTYDAKDTE